MEAAAPPISSNPNLTTSVFHTNLGLFALSWSRNVISRSLHLHLLLDNPLTTTATDDQGNNTLSPFSDLSVPAFHLHIKPFIFWKKTGSKKLVNNINTTSAAATTNNNRSIRIFWNLSRAKFGSGPEPQSGYYIAVVVDGELTLLTGDSLREAYAKTRAKQPPPVDQRSQLMVLRREHVYANFNKVYTTKAIFGGKTRDISVDCRVSNGTDDPKLCFHVGNKRVLQVKHLMWKFRGNERIQADGVSIQISWDVYNWLFENDHEDGYALFTFRFEKLGVEDGHEDHGDVNGRGSWSKQSCGFTFEKKKMMTRSGMLSLRTSARSASSSSSSSLSSASSGCGTVVDWESVEESVLKEPGGFSLMIYAWKRRR